MKRLTLAAALLAALHLMGAAAQAALLTPTDLDALDLGVQVMPERASDFLTPDLSGQGGPVSRSIGTLVATVWLKNGLYTYRLVVTPAESGVGQFSTQFNVDGFDPSVHKAGWSYSQAIQAGVVGSPSSAFVLIWSQHNGNAMLLNWTVNPSQTGFWSNRTPLTFFFQSPYGPQLSSYNFATSQGGSALNYGPSAMSLTLSYDGKLRDRVGQGSVALGADGALDGTLTATLSTTGGRTIRRLQLQSNAPGTWDTDSASPAWVLGVASTLDGALLNDAATMGVNFSVPDGGSFNLFAADYANIEFVPGVTLTLTATFSDGTTLTATTVAGTVTPSTPPSLTLSYDGKLRDRVGPGSVGLGADGALDGTLTATLSAAGGRTVTHLQLHSSAPGTWDTEAVTSAWVLGAASSLDGPLLNDPATMAANFAVADGGSFKVFAADFADIEFAPGTTLTLTVRFSDGTTLTAMTVASTVTPPSPPSLTLSYDGKLRDRVGQSDLGLGADGALDGTLTATLSASGGRTVTRLQLQSSAPGTWDTDAATSAWVLGVASTLDGALLNDPATMAVNFAVSNGGSFHVFAADWANIEFAPGTTLTLTAVFSDGTSARGSVTVPSL